MIITHILVKKDNDTFRHFALKVQQLVEAGKCNENASTKNLHRNGNFTEGLPKNLKDFANKRQVKYIETYFYRFWSLLFPSIH